MDKNRNSMRIYALIIFTNFLLPSKLLANQPVIQSALKHGHAVLQLGGYWGTQGKTQHINIQGLIGDEFTTNNNDNKSNGLVGLGYFLDGQDKDLFTISYGINAFYLAKTAITGDVVQENLFTLC